MANFITSFKFNGGEKISDSKVSQIIWNDNPYDETKEAKQVKSATYGSIHNAGRTFKRFLRVAAGLVYEVIGKTLSFISGAKIEEEEKASSLVLPSEAKVIGNILKL